MGRPRADAIRRKPVRPPAESVGPMPSPAAAAASSRPAAATARAAPGHAWTGWPPAGVTVTRLASSAVARPSTATIQPDAISFSRQAASRAARPASRSGPLTQYGGRPGPPGLSRSSDLAGRLADDRPGCWMPASRSSPLGCSSSGSSQGSSSSGGVSTTMARLADSARPDRLSARLATMAPTTVIGHSSGTKAAPTVTARPVAHAARRACFGERVNIWPASRPMRGISTKATALPRRPAAMAPKAMGRRA